MRLVSGTFKFYTKMVTYQKDSALILKNGPIFKWSNVSSYSNNAFKTPSTSDTIDVLNEGGAILMPQNK